MDHYLWPKMLGLAERAWSAPSAWETMDDAAVRESAMANDWSDFATRLGHFTLPLLTRYGFGKGVDYRLPPVGAKVENGKLMIRTGFPGVPVFYQINGGEEVRYEEPVAVTAGQKITLTTGVGERRSGVGELE
jgi:hexosaminidase